MSDHVPHLVQAAIARIVGDDPLAEVLVDAAHRAHPESFAAAAALTLVMTDPTRIRPDALRLASSRRDRQHLAVIDVWLSGDRDRGRLLARQHLSEFPDDLLVSWLAGRD